MRNGKLRCSLFGFGLSNTIVRSTRPQMSTLNRLKFNSHSPMAPPRRVPQAKLMVPPCILPHPNTSHPLVRPTTQLPTGHIQIASNTLPEPRVPLVSNVIHLSAPTRSTRVPAGTPSSAFAFGLFSFRSYACSRPHPDGWVIRHTSLPLIRILQPLQELESEAQLLNAPPLPIRKHPLQSSTFGTGLVDTTVRLTLEALILRFNTSDILGVLLCPRFAIRVRSCSTLSVSPIQACTCTCSPTVFPGTLYICRGSSVSVLPFGGTTDTARCTTYTADAGKLRLFDVRNPFN